MELAILAHDILAGVCKKYPTRFASLASFAPHSPKRAAREMERAVNQLGMNGFMVNSHTYDEYLDDPKFWPILEAAEALDRCLYIHPRAASDTLKGPLQDYGMDSAMWGYGVEVGTHAVRMMAGGVFDAFPKLKICIGHMGEAVPFWLWRLNFMNSRAQAAGRTRRTKRTMAEYFQDNFVVTNSGVEDGLALRYSIDKLGIANVMWAIDYPYQPMEPAVRFIEQFECTDEERHALCHGNAERVFHIAPS
jgi:2,3-dihydroxybenzoate decarboxylase/5-carboxyvanillate decarboxylase